ncbi:MAG: hypothetical protein UW30_C0004G0028 [Candidatus Giovannonibacteria bacterium GW2011_GWA2_44_13b]|uniref:Polymerase beta nucleotidyltransferase domain-containing protein n=1 Tax=Candidatus Giovannonibacteria bacterium GW2011_GWA2_44_13b TaxID=1618647 RepID=A0A0G1K1Z0_9BACT|nr:MAG: hypothetical protein UW30_C0004G0028 [Candidatus Giovannonibacteria bacterium GW2011_GWA2_44_13b]
MLNLTEEQKTRLKVVAEKYSLKFVVAHGSYATGKEHKGSDLDIAVLGIKEIPFHKQLELHGDLANIFGDNEIRELDLKELNKTDALFRYLVVRDGVLLCGNNADYEEFKAYARRDFELSKDLFDLEELLVKKQNKLLHRAYA